MAVQPIAPGERDIGKIVGILRQLAQGRSDAIGQFTLTPNAATTVVTALNMGADSFPFPVSLTAHAAAEIAAGTMWFETGTRGQFIVHHANNAQADRTFGYVALG